MKKGYGGDKKKGTKFATGLYAVNISEEYNSMGIYYQTWGNNEKFAGGTLSTNQTERQACWFKIGNCYQIDVREQMRIAKELTGYVRVGADKNNQDLLPL